MASDFGRRDLAESAYSLSISADTVPWPAARARYLSRAGRLKPWERPGGLRRADVAALPEAARTTLDSDPNRDLLVLLQSKLLHAQRREYVLQVRVLVIKHREAGLGLYHESLRKHEIVRLKVTLSPPS